MSEGFIASAREEKFAAATAYMAAMARMQELDLRRYASGGLLLTLTAEEEVEYEKLHVWWQALGWENQTKLKLMAKDMSVEAFTTRLW